MFQSSKALNIKRLQSGGVITNYSCTSRCAHCLYNCSPHWGKDYIDELTAARNLRTIKSLGCHSVHIGGGEPFLNLQGLAKVLRVARQSAVAVEYVETNSSWYKNQDSAVAILQEMKRAGLTTLLVSISPFHNEHIPFYRVKGVIEACRLAGISVFPWIREFIPEIDSMDDRLPHKLSEYTEKFGSRYVQKIPYRYWVHFGGRALKTYRDILPSKDLQTLFSSSGGGCTELTGTSHFHLDLFGNYIPGLCSGLSIECDDLGSPLQPERYPLISMLFERGIRAFFDLAVGEFGFEPSDRYLSKCHLCFEIRSHLVLRKNAPFRELQPRGHYENA